MSVRPPHPFNAPLRTGYTLLELMLALALSTVLIAAISTSLYGYYALRDAGERQIDETRSRMALLAQFREDISAIVRQLDQSPVAAVAESGIVDNSATAFSERLLNASPLFSLDTLALYGDENFLAIGELVSVSDGTKTSPSNSPLEQRAVIWSQSRNPTLTVPYITPEQTTLFHSLKVGEDYHRGPLASYRGFHADVAGVQRSTIAIRDNPKLLELSRYQPAVESLRFRYHDGEQWQRSWNSAMRRRLPAAVELTIINTVDPESLRYVVAIAGGES